MSEFGLGHTGSLILLLSAILGVLLHKLTFCVEDKQLQLQSHDPNANQEIFLLRLKAEDICSVSVAVCPFLQYFSSFCSAKKHGTQHLCAFNKTNMPEASPGDQLQI